MKPLPAGPYMLAMTWFRRQKAGDGGSMIRAKFECLYGPCKGRGFFTFVSLNFRKPMAAARFAAYCHAIGNEDPIDERSDKEIRKRFINRPFMARVTSKKETYQGREQVRNDIEAWDEMSQQQAQFAANWYEERAAEEAARSATHESALGDSYDGGDPNDPGPGDDDAPPQRRGRGRADDWDEGGGGGGQHDDDPDKIPF
jgi:hypothetical protein